MNHTPSQLHFGYRTASTADELLSVSQEDRRRHVYVIGQTGSGKTTFLKSCILQDLERGKGIALIDPHGDLAEAIADAVPRSRMRDVVFFNPSDFDHPLAFNPLGRVPKHLHAVATSNIIASLRSIWRESWGPRMEHVLANTLAALMEAPEGKPMTLLDVSKMLTDPVFQQRVLSHVSDPIVRDFWQVEFAGYDPRLRAEIIAPVLNKVGAFMRNPIMRNILGQTRKGFDLRYMMDNKKILIVNLSKGRLGEDMTNLLGSLLTTSIYQAAMERAELVEEEREDFHLYIDEFQNFTTDAFDSIVSEARKYRLSLTVAHQYLDQLSPRIKQAILGNVGSLLLFALSGKDAEELAVETNPHTASSLRATGRGEALAVTLKDGERRQPEKILVPYGHITTNSYDRVVRNTRTRFGQRPLFLT
ncbi:type IV secretion system DNA-binding domain-containing protein [Yoonia sp. GPGPB17]|uniref:type IV secretory system conjugative DNA transfer family protein n=1 Tax=Yoonia sp. GPGPB17 TaxID=3026147 RepID=UPI0030C27F71